MPGRAAKGQAFRRFRDERLAESLRLAAAERMIAAAKKSRTLWEYTQELLGADGRWAGIKQQCGRGPEARVREP